MVKQGSISGLFSSVETGQEVTSLGNCSTLLHIKTIIPSTLLSPSALIQDQGFPARALLMVFSFVESYHIKAIHHLYDFSTLFLLRK